MFERVQAKHVAAFTVGSYAGFIVSLTLIARRHNREIEKKNAVINDLKTLSTRLAGGLDNFNPGVTKRIFEDMKFEQIIRDVEV